MTCTLFRTAIFVCLTQLYGNNQVVKDDLQKLKVSKQNAAVTQKKLEEEIFDKWVEGVEVSKASGIPVDQIDSYLDHLQEAYEGIDDDIRKHMNAIDWTEKWTSKIFEFKYNDEHAKGVRFGMIAFGKSDDNKMVDCIISLYQLDFKITPDITEKLTNHSALFGLIQWQTSETKFIQRTISADAIENLQNFFRVKSLEGLLKEGVIDTIADAGVTLVSDDANAKMEDTKKDRNDNTHGEL